MKYKQVLLIVFLLAMFINQQVQAAKTTPSVENPSQKNSASADTLYNYVSVNVYHLNNPGGQLKDNPPKKCWTLGYIDPEFGCGTGDPLHPDIAQNPITFNKEDLEKYYLKDVLSREMDVSTNDPTLAALRAQAIASRTVATWKAKYLPDPYNDDPNYSQIINNSTDYQVYDPGAYNTYLNPHDSAGVQQMISTAISSTNGQYLSAGGYVIDTEFGSDMLGGSGNGGQSYLIPVDDPISTTCDAGNNSTRQGMSQLGAIRWSKGNQCAGSGNQPWPVKWSDYRQILAHYYTGVDILDGSGNKVAPDNRWNLLNYTGFPESIGANQTISLNLTVQNTSTTLWNNDVILGWKWVSTAECDSAWTTDNTHYLSADPGKNVTPNPTITITTPSNPGTYILHLDVKRAGGNWFQDQTPKWPDAQIQVQVGGEASIDPTAGAGFYPQGLTGCYYNDTQPASIPPAPPDPPINWITFTNFVTKVPNEAPLTFWRTTPLTSPLTGVNNTFWSARWIGKLNVVQAGNYTFHLAFLDDGGRIFIDKITDNDTPLIESWYTQGQHNYTSNSVYLTAGLHNVRIDYAQGPMLHSSMYVGWSCLECPYVISGSFIGRSLPLPPAITISGNIGIPGAILYYIDGVAKSVTADTSGNYSLTVPYGWSGTVTPSLAGYTFNPASISYPATYADQASTTPDFVPTSVPTLTVTNTSDSGSGSLRDAIAYANPGATILFASNLSGQTINLNNTLFISKNITIDGSMLSSPVILSGAGVTPHVTVLTINTGITATLKNLTIANGKPGINNSGVLTIRNSNIVNNSSSGIVNNGGGDLTITDTIISNNAGDTNGGGGISNSNNGKVTVISSTVSNNTATVATYSSGGGVFNLGKLIVMSSTFSSNTSSASGGGINNKSTGELEVISSTFYGNVATGNTAANVTGLGGGIYNSISYPKYVTVTNSTFANNSADKGGGIYHSGYSSYGYLVVTNSTFSDNVAILQGGGIYNNSRLYYVNSILANSIGGDCANDIYNGSITVNINNLVEDGSCSAGITGDPALGIFGSNGGPTQTMALLPGSPAINAGDNILCGQSPVNDHDQRGVLRTHDTQCDLGAYEYYVDPAIPTVGTFTAPTTSTSLNIPITSLTASDDMSVTGYMITESAIAPTYSGNGWSSTPPMAYTVSTEGSYVLYPWVKDADGNVSVVYSSPASVNVALDTTPPTTTSITRASTNPTNAASVNYTVTFSEPVTGVAANDFSLTVSGLSGASITSVNGSGNNYTVTVNTGSGSGTLKLIVPATATIYDSVGNALSSLPFTTGQIYNVRTNTFSDVPVSYWAWEYIERAYSAGVTGGCSTNPLMYCPETNVTRDVMAVFLLRAKYGSSYTPPPVGSSTGFNDVPTNYWAAAWIKELAAEGITGGCGNGNYCPGTVVTRDQMAIFLLRAKHGATYTPPAATGTMFTDVPQNYWAAAWIEQLVNEGISGGCTATTFCPSTSVTRAQMAIFLVRTFNLP